jgi:hypothetical protein
VRACANFRGAPGRLVASALLASTGALRHCSTFYSRTAAYFAAARILDDVLHLHKPASMSWHTRKRYARCLLKSGPARKRSTCTMISKARSCNTFARSGCITTRSSSNLSIVVNRMLSTYIKLMRNRVNLRAVMLETPPYVPEYTDGRTDGSNEFARRRQDVASVPQQAPSLRSAVPILFYEVPAFSFFATLP